jgi:hypothetical protein
MGRNIKMLSKNLREFNLSFYYEVNVVAKPLKVAHNTTGFCGTQYEYDCLKRIT